MEIRFISFLVKVSDVKFPIIKTQVINAISKFAEDDTGYWHHPDKSFELKNKGQEVAFIDSVRPAIYFDLNNDLKKILYAMHNAWPYSKKHVFIIVDRYKPEYDYGFKVGFKFDLKNELNTSFTICGIGDKYDKEALKNCCQYHPNCKFIHLDKPDELGKHIEEEYECQKN